MPGGEHHQHSADPTQHRQMLAEQTNAGQDPKQRLRPHQQRHPAGARARGGIVLRKEGKHGAEQHQKHHAAPEPWRPRYRHPTRLLPGQRDDHQSRCDHARLQGRQRQRRQSMSCREPLGLGHHQCPQESGEKNQCISPSWPPHSRTSRQQCRPGERESHGLPHAQ